MTFIIDLILDQFEIIQQILINFPKRFLFNHQIDNLTKTRAGLPLFLFLNLEIILAEHEHNVLTQTLFDPQVGGVF